MVKCNHINLLEGFMGEEFLSDMVMGDEYEVKKHSGIGISSCILGVISLILFVIIIYMSLSTSGEYYGNEVETTMIGLMAILLWIISIIGIVLGIVGVCIKGKKKLFSILGISFNSVSLVTIVGIMLLGLSML